MSRPCKTGDDFRYAARVYKQKALEEKALEDIKIIAYNILSGDSKYDVTKASAGEWFDGYTYCHNKEKQWCGRGRYKYKGYLHHSGDGYCFFSNSEIGIWCKLIEKVLGDQLFFPCV